MGLRSFTHFVKRTKLAKCHQLSNTQLIVDGSGITGRLYERCTTDSTRTRDYDFIAETTSEFFQDFVDCNVECFVVFDGGHNDLNMTKKIERLKDKIVKAQNAVTGKESAPPILLENVVMEVLDDMKIPYVICEEEEADEIIAALAKDFGFPILSADSDFYMTEAKFISYYSISRRENNFIPCMLYDRTELLKKYNLTKEILPIVFLILENNYYLPPNFFNEFLSANCINTNEHQYFLRIHGLLLWLKNKTNEEVLADILRNVLAEEQKHICSDIIHSAELIISPNEPDTYSFCFMTNYGADPENVIISQNDPDWFQKGILIRRIPKPYIDLCKKNKFLVSAQLENFGDDDSFVPCFRILRYAFDLLKGFTEESIEYVGRSGVRKITTDFSIGNLDDSNNNNPFGSGWHSLPDYFGNFVRQTMPGFPSTALNDLPEDCRLWMIALVWWRQYARDMNSETHCLLLCRATAGVDMNYLRTSPRDARMPHGFAQFQNVLQQIDYLCRLCVAPYVSIRYCDAYCDSVARGALAAMTAAGVEPRAYVEGLLKNASPAAYKLYGKLVSVYDRCVAALILE